jgi:hypothetical protein
MRISRLLTVAIGATMALCLLTPAAAQDAVLTKREATLRDKPEYNAAALAALPAQTPLSRLPARQGPWIQVKTSTGTTGWVHMFDVGGSAPASNSATSALRGLSSFFNRGSASATNTTPTSTVGIRGLGAEDIANAQPNAAALARAEGFRQDATQARRFAADAALVTRPVEPLPVPAPPTTPGKEVGQ